MSHPFQAIFKDAVGRFRFERNEIVCYLLSTHPSFDMNTLESRAFSVADKVQLAMLTGYSLDGFMELPYVNNELCEAVEKFSNGIDAKEARIEELERKLKTFRQAREQLKATLADLMEIDIEYLG